MIFGDPLKLAIEVALESNPLARFLVKEPLGRIRVWAGGQPFGNWEEPSCPFGGLEEELREKAAPIYEAWHPSLELKTPTQRFQALDELLYHPGSADRITSTLDYSSIFLNTVECFDEIKAFALTPSEGLIQILISNQANKFSEVTVSKGQIKLIAAELKQWISSNRRDA